MMNRFLILSLIVVGGCTSNPVAPLGVFQVTTRFPDGRVLVSLCHSEQHGRVLVCDPPLPFPAPR